MTTLQQIKETKEALTRLELQLETEDKLKGLKKAYSEDAIIEYKKEYPWDVTINPTWCTDYEYRIKDDISISSWNKHKDLIKLWWKGAKIEIKLNNISWSTRAINPAWNITEEYRVKDIWKLPEYEDGSEYIISGTGAIFNSVFDSNDKSYTKTGRRRATRELAERCAKASKQRDLLEAWRDHIDPDWIDKGKGYEVTYIYFDGTHYLTGANSRHRIVGTVYMSQDTAKKICEALNNGDISLGD